MIILKTKEEVDLIREGGKKIASVLRSLSDLIKPGVSTSDLEKLARKLIDEAGGRPSFLGYRSGRKGERFPTALCVSINDEVVHAPAFPERFLADGDIVSIDLGMEYPFVSGKSGYYTDMAETFAVGNISRDAKKLLNITKECLDLAIAQVKPGNNLNNIARAVQEHAEKNGFSVVRDLVGHGVGKDVHEDPQIPNFVVPANEAIILQPGMVIAIEPMINLGRPEVKTINSFTIATKDGSLSAHFEHTIAVTAWGCEVMTRI